VDQRDFLKTIQSKAETSGVFEQVTAEEHRVVCKALNCPSPVDYRVEIDSDGQVWVSLVTPDRWMSESIETDLMHTGDDLDDLLEDELVEHDVETRLKCEHYRSEDRLYTFRSRLPIRFESDGTDPEKQADLTIRCLLAYEACFRELGDVMESYDSG